MTSVKTRKLDMSTILAVVKAQNSSGAIEPPEPVTTGYAVLTERQNTGVTSTVTFSGATPILRQLNNVVNNSLNITLSGTPSWTFTIPAAGTYSFKGRACFSTTVITYGRPTHFSRISIKNETLGIDNVIAGDTCMECTPYNADPGNINNRNIWCQIDGILTLTANTVLSMRMFSYPSGEAGANFGGRAINVGPEEVYAVLTIEKLA